MRSKGLLLLLMAHVSFLHAQPSLQTNIWYFGNQAGLDFNSGAPVALTNGSLNTLEGTASIADRTTGQLLFYTDGITVYDSTHGIMLNGNGLLGHPSATQSGVIVPDPGNDSLYYIFTVGAQAGALGGNYGGIAYSVVDMRLNGGLGAVTTKNVQLVNPASEKISSVRHCNGHDVWVVTHQWNTNAFYSYLVTDAGVQPPVISNAGIIHANVGSPANWESIGYMKVSPDQQHIGLCAFYPMNVVEIFDFDNVLGVVSNGIRDTFPASSGYGGPYGCSFSPDGSRFYAGIHNYAGAPNFVAQYDITLPTAAAVLASRTFVATTSAVSYGALQLASDGKMYMATFSNNSLGGPIGSPTIDRFNNPNGLGLASGYVANAVFLGGGFSIWGLPDYIESFFSPPAVTNFNDTSFCTGGTATFNPVYEITLDSLNWYFDDPASGAANTSTLPSASHTFNSAGVYNVSLIVHYNCHHDTISRTVTVTDLAVSLGNDTTLCNGTSLSLDPGYPGAVYSWSNGATTQSLTISNNLTGVYWVEVTDGPCVARDSINVTFNPPPVVSLGNDTTVCANQTVTLDAGNPGSAYTWSNGSTTQTITVPSTGSYWVVADLSGCTDRDTVLVTLVQPATVFLGNDTVLCNGQSLAVTASIPGYTVLWSDGSTSGSLSVTAAGTIWVQMSNGFCIITDTINVQFNPPPSVSLGNDTTVCATGAVTLDAGNPGSAYIWSNGATTQTITPVTTGNYWVVANISGCTDSDTVLITVNQPPALFLGNDTTLCIGQTLTLSASAPGYSNLWSDGTTGTSISISASGTSWVQMDDGTCLITDTINVQFNQPPVVSLGNDTTFCDGGQVTLDAGNAGSAYQWSTGATTQTITVTQTGNYTVEANLTGCRDSDTLAVTVQVPPPVFLGNDTSLCAGEILQLSASAAGYTNLWSTGSTLSSVSVGTAGNYWVQLDDGICTASDTIDVQFDLPPVVNIGNDTVLCIGQSFTLDAGIPGALYLWSSGATTQVITVVVQGKYHVNVTAGACTRTDTMVATFNQPLAIDLGNDTVLCAGQSVVLDAGAAGYIYLWSTGETTQSITVSTQGMVNFQLFDGICTAYDSISVLVVDYPVVFLGADTFFCSNTPLTLDAGNPGAVYLWSTGESTQSIVPATADTYWAMASFYSCSDSDTIGITVLEAPEVYLGEDTSLCSGDVVRIDAGNTGAAYLWSDGTSGQALTVTKTGIYAVTVTNADGCMDQDSIEFGTLGCEFYLFLPNTFTPNRDGRNDNFYPYTYNVLTLKMTIFNRWGQLLFETEDFFPGWDGKYREADCPEDVYIVQLEYGGVDEKGNNVKKHKKSKVLLLR